MAYVLKNAQGEVIAASAEVNPGEPWVYVDAKAREYVDFLEQSLAKADFFRESDIHLARVLEDLIGLLIERNIIRFTDLPMAAQKRLNERQSMRKTTDLSELLDDSSLGL